MASFGGAFVALFLLAGGLFGIYWGLQRRRPHELITETPTTEVRNLREPGIVELKGTARPLDPDDDDPIVSDATGGGSTDRAAPFTSPIGQREDTLLSAWTVREWDESGDNSTWKTIASGVWSVPFVVDDGTGEVVVEAGDHADQRSWFSGVTNFAASDGVSVGDVLCEFQRFPVVAEVGAERPTPEHIRNFVASEGAVDRQSGSITNLVDIGNAHGDRKYYEQTINVGDEVYVLGHAYERQDAFGAPGPEQMVVTEPYPEDDGMLIVSDEREQDLVRQTRYHQLGLALGALCVLAGVSLLLRGLFLV